MIAVVTATFLIVKAHKDKEELIINGIRYHKWDGYIPPKPGFAQCLALSHGCDACLGIVQHDICYEPDKP
jgi:hypothetical protein